MNHRKRYHLRRKAQKLRLKIKNLVKDLHCRLAKYLVDNYHYVLLPKFETSKMVIRGNRKIHSDVARQMLSWKHFEFRKRMMDKTRESPWCKVLIVDEHLTSQTCSDCGNRDSKLGSKKQYNCKQCKFQGDRDANAAKNIFLRFLMKNQCPSNRTGNTTH